MMQSYKTFMLYFISTISELYVAYAEIKVMSLIFNFAYSFHYIINIKTSSMLYTGGWLREPYVHL